MIIVGESMCPICGGNLKYYDKVSRIVRTRYNKTDWVHIRRLRCLECSTLHRELPEYLMPYKHYEREVILGVIEGFINSDILGFEDHPCELAMKKWITAR